MEFSYFKSMPKKMLLNNREVMLCLNLIKAFSEYVDEVMGFVCGMEGQIG